VKQDTLKSLAGASSSRLICQASHLLECARGQVGATLLIIALSRLHIFEMLERGPMTVKELQRATRLSQRPFLILTTALREMKTLLLDASGRFHLTEMSRHCLLRSNSNYLGGYAELMVSERTVQELLSQLRSDRPRSWHGKGPAFNYRRGNRSPLNNCKDARSLTLSLAGLARSVAPMFADNVKLDGCNLLLDVGAGTGVYSMSALQRNPNLRAILMDRPEVLKVARGFALESGLENRVTFVPGDILRDHFPRGIDAILLSNVLHDWDEDECQRLIRRCVKALRANGRLLIHDKFIGSSYCTPLSAAMHSASLFVLTEGRLYSVAEVAAWMKGAGVRVDRALTPTAAGYSVMIGVRRSGG
jgi:SAM-dependent methyltransferase